MFKAGFTKGQTALIKSKISSATGSNFASIQKELDGELSPIAGRNFLAKTRSRLSNKAKELGIDFDGKAWASEAIAEAKRKFRQDEYVKGKIEEAKNVVEEEKEEEAVVVEEEKSEGD